MNSRWIGQASLSASLTRRDWLKLVGAGLAGCSMPPGSLPWPDSDPDGRWDPGPIEPEHAAATFEVGATDALIAVWAPAVRLALPVVEDVETGVQATADVIEIRGDAGGTGAGVLGGLQPGRRYRWHLRFDTGTTSEWYGLRAAPAAETPAPLTFLYSADIDLSPAYDSPIFDSMAGSGADFFVCLGDWPYADNAPGAVTVDEYRARHLEARAAAKVQRLLRTMGTYAIWDDHEYRNNWDGRFALSDPDRLAAAVQVWDDWFPLRDASTPRRRYRSWRWGALAELFLLDTRLYRSRNDAPDDAAKTMLGAEQKQWLIDGLLASTAAFKLVFTTVPLDFGNDNDDWSLFRTERDQILSALAGAAVPGVAFLSADQHWFASHHHAAGVVEWQVGPLCREFRGPPAPAPGVVTRITGVYNYGDVAISGGDAPELTFTARDPEGTAIYTETLSAT